MKKNRILTLLLLIAFSFQITHAFVVDMFETHEHIASEYVEEFSHLNDSDASSDICDIHAAFHIAFLVPSNTSLLERKKTSETPLLFSKSYTFYTYETSIRPPITL